MAGDQVLDLARAREGVVERVDVRAGDSKDVVDALVFQDLDRGVHRRHPRHGLVLLEILSGSGIWRPTPDRSRPSIALRYGRGLVVNRTSSRYDSAKDGPR